VSVLGLRQSANHPNRRIADGSRQLPHHNSTTACDAPPIRLLKLHGSLNWVVRTRGQRPSRQTLFPGNRSPAIFVHNIRDVVHDSTLSGTTGGRSSWYLWPTIVPPIYDKWRLTNLPAIRSAWERARTEIALAEKLIFVGYSLPEADVLARQMLRRVYQSNKAPHSG
jgi:hypothetical protein